MGDLVLVHHSRLPPWAHNCLQDPFFGPDCVIEINGSGIHVRCSPRLGWELRYASTHLRHCRSPDGLSWDEWRLTTKEVERINRDNAVASEEADELQENTAEEMAADGYHLDAGIACRNYKEG